jgi:signal transduction histidine kinase
MIMNKHLNYNDKEDEPRILYEPKDILLRADRIRIPQVISNLLSYAIKFTPEGTISIISSLNSIDKNDNEAIVIIKDNGQGIYSDMLPSLFSKFAAKSFAGTGLGLFICKSIVEAHGGRIWVQNNSDTKGAIFSFTHPLDKLSRKIGIGVLKMK